MVVFGTCIRNLEFFPNDIKQLSPVWCIPACVEAVIKYHDPSSTVNQSWLVDEYRKIEHDFSQISFDKLTEAVLKPRLKAFDFSVHHPTDFKQWCFIITSHVQQDLPPIISLRHGGGGSHMNVVLGFTSRDFYTYDPSPSFVAPIYHTIELLANSRADILIIKHRTQVADQNMQSVDNINH